MQLLETYIYVVSPMAAWVVAQVVKLLFCGLARADWSWRYLYRSGGMPSSHSAVITSLCAILALREGTASASFGIACTLAAIIMYDAMNVRHAVGEHSNALREILPAVFKDKMPEKVIVHQSNGHTPTEVFVGMLIGVITSIGLYLVVK